MNKEEFLTNLEDVLQCECSLEYDLVLEDLEEWDSVSKIATIAFLDNSFGVKITFNELSEIKTVGDLAKKAGI